MKCPSCSHDVSPVIEFATEGMLQRCPRAECGGSLGLVPSASTVAKVAPVAVKRAKRAPAESFDVIKAAKARLREVKRQLKAMKALEVERDQLTRLLAAAERAPAGVKRLHVAS
jgi:hypothetical protein